MDSIILCLFILQPMYSDSSESWNEKVELQMPDRISVCVSVMEEADRQGVPPNLSAAVAWHESKFNADAVSKAGAVGPLQILPRYWCPLKKLKDCDLVVEGVSALKVYIEKYDNYKKALCHYNSGNKCSNRSKTYARRVLITFNRLNYIEAFLFD